MENENSDFFKNWCKVYTFGVKTLSHSVLTCKLGVNLLYTALHPKKQKECKKTTSAMLYSIRTYPDVFIIFKYSYRGYLTDCKLYKTIGK